MVSGTGRVQGAVWGGELGGRRGARGTGVSGVDVLRWRKPHDPATRPDCSGGKTTMSIRICTRASQPHRCRWLLFLVLLSAGCGGASSEPELVWGRRGVQGGDLVKPRAIA